MNEEAKLLPCPFCEGDAEIEGPREVEPHLTYIACMDCGAQIFRRSERDAIAAWNTRAALAQHEAPKAELVAHSDHPERDWCRDCPACNPFQE